MKARLAAIEARAGRLLGNGCSVGYAFNEGWDIRARGVCQLFVSGPCSHTGLDNLEAAIAKQEDHKANNYRGRP